MEKTDISKWTSSKALPVRVSEKTLREFFADMKKYLDSKIEQDKIYDQTYFNKAKNSFLSVGYNQ